MIREIYTEFENPKLGNNIRILKKKYMKIKLTLLIMVIFTFGCSKPICYNDNYRKKPRVIKRMAKKEMRCPNVNKIYKIHRNF